MKSTKDMTVSIAIDRLMCQIVSAESSEIEALNTCLQLGGGQIWLFEPETLYMRPAGLVSNRRSAFNTLSETIYLDGSNDPEARFQPCYTGPWESVLATLVIDGNWTKIEETALELILRSC